MDFMPFQFQKETTKHKPEDKSTLGSRIGPRHGRQLPVSLSLLQPGPSSENKQRYGQRQKCHTVSVSIGMTGWEELSQQVTHIDTVLSSQDQGTLPRTTLCIKLHDGDTLTLL